MEHIDALGKQCPIPVMMAKKLIDQDLDGFTIAVDNKTATQNLRNLAKLSFYDTSIESQGLDNFLVSFVKCGRRAVPTLHLSTADIPTAQTDADARPGQSIDDLFADVDDIDVAASVTADVAADTAVATAATAAATATAAAKSAEVAWPTPAELAAQAEQAGQAQPTPAAPDAPENPLTDTAALGDYVVFVRQWGIGSGSAELGHNLMKMALYTLAEGELPPKAMLFMNEGVRLPASGDAEICGHLQRLQQRGCELLVCGACLNYYGLAERLSVGSVSNMYEILGRMQSAGKTITL